ncbi:MAG: hypothetical protein AAB528_04425, partial [Chloroflexota bacterium]
ATVFISRLQDAIQVIEDYPSNAVKFSWRKTIVGTEANGFQLELACHTFTTHMYVFGFVAIEAVKEKPVWARNARNRRH